MSTEEGSSNNDTSINPVTQVALAMRLVLSTLHSQTDPPPFPHPLRQYLWSDGNVPSPVLTRGHPDVDQVPVAVKLSLQAGKTNNEPRNNTPSVVDKCYEENNKQRA